jgi:hypothetical protein
MAKKHKKIFKQKLRQMLVTAEPTPVVHPSQPLQATPSPQAPALRPSPTSVSLIKPDLIKSDLKKIAFLFLIILVLIATAVIISDKTNWFSIVADKIYNWAQLGA